VLESPDSISKTVLARGLDAGTAFEILSIDIADVDVGVNVGAALQVAQAEANKNMAQAQPKSAAPRRCPGAGDEARVQEMQRKSSKRRRRCRSRWPRRFAAATSA